MKTEQDGIKPLIKNTSVERMFLRICNDDEMVQYTRLAESSTARATAYASRKIVPVFDALVAGHERQTGGQGLEGLKTVVYRANSRR